MLQRPQSETLSAPPRNLKRLGKILLAVALIIAVIGIAIRLVNRMMLSREAAEGAIPTVLTVKPQREGAGEEIVLPGNVQAFNQAAIFARVSGYLKIWNTDIGTPVKAGQVLAEIDAPELDQQLLQAQADLATAEANSKLAETTNQRWKKLLATDSVSKQDADEKAGDAAAKKALVDSAKANVARLQQLQSFKQVIAPFDGTVTARNTDIGNLINAGAGNELFRVADTRKLRVFVQVPQSYATAATPGLQATLHFAERPGQSYPAQITRTANALDPNSRTLQVELGVDNAKGDLFPGSYAEVHFTLQGAPQTVRVPATAVIFRADGLQVATVGADHRVKLKQVTPGRDFGSAIEIIAGLDPQDDIVQNPPDSLAEGAEVRLAPKPAQPDDKAPDKGKAGPS